MATRAAKSAGTSRDFSRFIERINHMFKRQSLVQLLLAGVMLLALSGVVPAVAQGWLAAQTAQPQAVATELPERPLVNWNS
jgi:hypothetical protein